MSEKKESKSNFDLTDMQRDLFAAAALQGLLAGDGDNGDFCDATEAARAAVAYADALIRRLDELPHPLKEEEP